MGRLGAREIDAVEAAAISILRSDGDEDEAECIMLQYGNGQPLTGIDTGNDVG